MRSEKFGRLLKGAVGSIAVHEGKTAPIIEEELGSQLGVTAASIQRYKAGHIPPNPQAIEFLATSALTRGYLNQEWLRAFLQAARYPAARQLIERLYPQALGQVKPRTIYTNLPAPNYQRFVMRSASYAQVIEGLQQRSALTQIVSLGGMGKTSLAREIAGKCADGKITTSGAFFCGVVWLSDSKQPGTTSLETVLNEITLVMDYPILLQAELKNRQREIETILRQQPILLVVDNYETVDDKTLSYWLLNVPEPSKVLITSRELLAEFQNTSWLVQLGGLHRAEAGEFIENKLQAAKIEVGGLDIELDQLLAVTGGNPKAIELALGWLKHGQQAFAEVLSQLEVAQPDFFATMFEHCWEIIERQPDSQQLLIITTFFVGSVAAPALETISQLGKNRFHAALACLTNLFWLDVHSPTGYGLYGQAARYSMHPLVSTFVKSKLVASNSLSSQIAIKSVREKQLEWYLKLSAQVGYCWDDLAKLELLDNEQETIANLLEWCLAEQKFSQLLELTKNIDYYYYIRGLWALEPNVSYLRVLAARQTGSFEEEVAALSYYSQMLCRRNQLEQALTQLDHLENLLKSRETELTDSLWFEVQYSFGIYFMACGEIEKAIVVWRASLERAAKVSVRAYAVSRGWLATCLYQQGVERAEAEGLWEAILQEATEHGFLRGIVSSQTGLARICLDRNQLEQAQSYLAQAYEIAQRGEERQILAEILTLYSQYYAAVGQQLQAQKCLREAQDVLSRLGNTVVTG